MRFDAVALAHFSYVSALELLFRLELPPGRLHPQTEQSNRSILVAPSTMSDREREMASGRVSEKERERNGDRDRDRKRMIETDTHTNRQGHREGENPFASAFA